MRREEGEGGERGSRPHLQVTALTTPKRVYGSRGHEQAKWKTWVGENPSHTERRRPTNTRGLKHETKEG